MFPAGFARKALTICPPQIPMASTGLSWERTGHARAPRISPFAFPDTADPPEFDGRDCESFIRAVRRAAFRTGNSRDNDWMADFATTCFTGQAFQWYERLDLKVRENWEDLKMAVLEEYPPTNEVHRSVCRVFCSSCASFLHTQPIP